MKRWTFGLGAMALVLTVGAPMAAGDTDSKAAPESGPPPAKAVELRSTGTGAKSGAAAGKQAATPEPAVKWIKDYDEALKQAAANKKGLFVFIRRHC